MAKKLIVFLVCLSYTTDAWPGEASTCYLPYSSEHNINTITTAVSAGGFVLNVSNPIGYPKQRTVTITGSLIGLMIRAFDGKGNDAAGTFGPASHPLPSQTKLNGACFTKTASVCHTEGSSSGSKKGGGAATPITTPLYLVFEAYSDQAAAELQFVAVLMSEEKNWVVLVPPSQDPSLALGLLKGGYSDSAQLTTEYSYVIIPGFVVLVAFLTVGSVVNLCLRRSKTKYQQTSTFCLRSCCHFKRLGGCFISNDEALVSATFVLTQLASTIATLISLMGQDYAFKNAAARATGIQCMLNLALTLLPINRTPMLVWLFGTSFERAVKLHRWHGRYTIAVVGAHLIASIVVQGELSTLFSNSEFMFFGQGYLWGVLSLLCFLVMLVTSFNYVRRNYFEVFYYSHFIFIAGFVFAVLHVSRFLYYLLIPVSLYALDRVLRFARGLCSVTVIKASMVSQDLKEKMVQLQLQFRGGWQKNGLCNAGFTSWKAGQYYFINIPEISLFEWHPISVACSSAEARHEVKGEESDYDLEFFIKQPTNDALNKSWAGQLAERIRSGKSLTVRIDGSFGNLQIDPNRYTVVNLVGGGVGLTPMLSLFGDLLYSRRIPVVRLVWIVRTEAELDVFAPTIEEFAKAYKIGSDKTVADARIFVTQDFSAEVPQKYPNITFQKGRPVWGPWLATVQRPNPKISVVAEYAPNEKDKQKTGPSISPTNNSKAAVVPMTDMGSASSDTHTAVMQKAEVAVCACGPGAMVEVLMAHSSANGYHFHDETFYL